MIFQEKSVSFKLIKQIDQIYSILWLLEINPKILSKKQ